MTEILRLALVADIHHGVDHFTKKGSAALGLMARFADEVASANPHAVIDLGDRISDCDHETDLRLEREVAEAFKAITQPIYHLNGNHDRDYLSMADNEAILGQSLAHQTVDIGGWRLVLWRADSQIRRPGGFLLTEHDLLWLAGVVREADRPLAIMSHVPVSGHSQIGNYYFQRNPMSSTYPGAERVRDVLRMARVPVMWVSGHVHWNTLTMVDGIPHFTLQSLTETFTTYPHPAASFAILELSDVIDWRVFGADTFSASLDVSAANRRWMTPLPPFEEHPEARMRRLQDAANGTGA
jgi:hypothetical protein